jgi:hypothetical protein
MQLWPVGVESPFEELAEEGADFSDAVRPSVAVAGRGGKGV